MMAFCWALYVLLSERLLASVYGRDDVFGHLVESADAAALRCLVIAAAVCALTGMAAVAAGYRRQRPGGRKGEDIGTGKKYTPKERMYAAFTLCMVFSIIVLLWYGVHRYYVRNLEGFNLRNSPSYRAPSLPVLTADQSLDIGWAHTAEVHPSRSYLEFPPEKKPGTLRIGVFGCSFVKGSEVVPGHEFPSFLQNKFTGAGMANVEVINFGVDAYGLHQAYMMWDWAGKKFDLDIVVFLALRLHQARDRTFAHNAGSYTPIHGRFILEGNDVELVHVAGRTPLEATKLYFSFIPLWRYVRFDEKAPSAFSSILPLKGGSIENPFYYLRDKEDEILRTYSILFRALGKDAPDAVIILLERDYCLFRPGEKPENVNILESSVDEWRKSFLYKAPEGHPSATGQEIQAEELFDYLSGKKQSAFDYLITGCVEDPPPYEGITGPLCGGNDVSLNMEGFPVASFTMNDRRKGYENRFAGLVDFGKSGIASIVQESDGGNDRFFCLPFMLQESLQVNMLLQAEKDILQFPIGEVRSRAGVAGKVAIPSPVIRCAQAGSPDPVTIRLNSQNMPDSIEIAGSRQVVRELYVSLGNDIALRSTMNTGCRAFNMIRRILFLRKKPLLIYRFTLQPLFGGYVYLKATPGEYVDVSRLKNRQGAFEIVMKRQGEKDIRVPMFLGYRVEKSINTPFNVRYERLRALDAPAEKGK